MVRILLAVIVVIVAGFCGLVSLFSDYPSHWSFARYARGMKRVRYNGCS
jgi:hypothetical protein